MRFWFFHSPAKEKKPKMTTDEIDLAIEIEQRRAHELVLELTTTIDEQMELWNKRKGGGNL